MPEASASGGAGHWQTELEVFVEGFGPTLWSTLASHSQLTLSATGQGFDYDILRPPRAIPTKPRVSLQGSAEEQFEKAREVCAKPPCCLDSFTAKLAKQYGPEVLAAEEAKVFLKAVFDGVLPTSTYVERMFARLARWTETKGHKLHLSQLSAQHFTNTFSSIVETWREKARKSGIIARVGNNKERPSWVKGGRQQ